MNKPFDFYSYMESEQKLLEGTMFAFYLNGRWKYEPPFEIQPIGINEILEYLIIKLFDFYG